MRASSIPMGWLSWKTAGGNWPTANRHTKEGKAEAQAELDDAWEQILDAESDVREIEQGKWILGDRDDNVSFSS